MRACYLWLSAALVAAALSVGCGSDDGDSSESSASSGAIGAEAQDAIDQAYEGSFSEPPASSPKPEAGKNIWFITYGAAFVDFKAKGQILDAAKLLGWDVTMFDGEFRSDVIVDGLRQAIADGTDGIILYSIDCSIAKAGLEDVEKAGIPVAIFEGTDCNRTVDKQGNIVETGEPALFDAEVVFNDPSNPDTPLSFEAFVRDIVGYYQGLGVIAGTDGKGKIIKLKATDISFGVLADNGFERALADHCPACDVVETVDFVSADLGEPLQQKVAQAIARNPDANAIYSVYDVAAEKVAVAAQASGRSDEIFVMAGEGIPSIVDLIREDRGADAGIGYANRWEAWAALDAMNRLLHDEKPKSGGAPGFPSGFGVQLYDRDRNTPPAGTFFEGPVDFEGAYRKAWGVD